MQRLSRTTTARYPRIFNTSGHDADPDFFALADRYANLDAQALLIRAHLGTPYAPAVDGRLHLDSILSYAQVMSFPMTLAWGEEPSVIPLPIVCLWESEQGLPLWACSDLYPTSPIHTSAEYWHKRYPEQRMQDLAKKPNAPLTRGRYREYRVPIGVIMPEDATLTAHCLGHADSIRALLQYVQFVGKKPAQGKGRVLQWDVETLAMTDADVLELILRRRSVPLAYKMEMSSGISPRSGWTPPYWFKTWHAPVRLPE